MDPSVRPKEQPLGDGPDLAAAGAGVVGPLTRGIEDPLTDAVRALETARSLPQLDPLRTLVRGPARAAVCQTATAGLAGCSAPPLSGALVDVPFLCGYRRATEITDACPHREIADYLSPDPPSTFE